MIERLHDEVGITHGDLTTSNMLLDATTKEIVLLDFGLSTAGNNAEQRAVDLYVFIRALRANHSVEAESIVSRGHGAPFAHRLKPFDTQIKKMLEAYKSRSSGGAQGHAQLLKVEKRGRKRNLG